MRMYLFCRPQWTYMNETNKKKTAIELTGPCKHWHCYIILTWRWLVPSAGPNCCYKYNTLCQLCSSLWLNIVLLFTFRWLNLLQDPTFNQTGSLFKALQFVVVFFLYVELTTFHRHRVKFRFKLCSPYLFCLFKYFHLNSEWDVKCANSQILSLAYIFASWL